MADQYQPRQIVIAAADATEGNKRKADVVLLPGQALDDVLVVIFVDGSGAESITFRRETSYQENPITNNANG